MLIRVFLGMALVAGCAGVAPAGNAWADTGVIDSVAGWNAFAGLSPSNRPLCGVSTTGDGKYIGVKYFYGDDDVTIQLSHERWRVQNGSNIKVFMQFDDISPWQAIATGFHMSDGDAALQMSIPISRLSGWIAEFRGAYELKIGFLNTNANDWSVDLSGTNQIADSFAECLRAMVS